MKKLIWWLFMGSKGGINRAKITNLIDEKPCNAHQISEELNLNYKTVKHHLRLLEENNVIICTKGVSYGALFFISDEMEANYKIFEKIKDNLKIGE
ncbi:MAG: ArsR family transcriptional regulator [Methanobacteriales archaeon HGW-Methanobacteriales-1]|nr:MAG: ArsR family transcriptional regulator [Methanobacteriales archaeon HGW-Methanobacteriales-1]